VNATFRYAEEGDERPLARLDRVTWAPSNSPVPLWSEDVNFFASNPPRDVIVAVDGDATLGYVKLCGSSSLASNAHVVMIGGLAVNPDAQHKGLGSALVEKAIEEATIRGAKLLKLHVLGTNPVARRLYERCGFTVEGVLHNEFLLHGTFVDDVIMSKVLAMPE
jgi:ribosomal protein S18 acetylase RimI-like enzyme